jgi:hypothetical protein
MHRARTVGMGGDDDAPDVRPVGARRRLREALPVDAAALLEAVWALTRPVLSPRLTARHADEFVGIEAIKTNGGRRRAPRRVVPGRSQSRRRARARLANPLGRFTHA